MVDKVQVLVNDTEYFKVENIRLVEEIRGFISLRTTNIDLLLNTQKTKEFNATIKKQVLPIKVVVQGKVWQESFVGEYNTSIDRDFNSATKIRINLTDKFENLTNSDVIDVCYQNHKTLQIALSRTLTELRNTGFTIQNGTGVKDILLTNGGNQTHTKGMDCSQFIGGLCSMYKVLLKSNGVDTITIEKHNGNQEVVDQIYYLVDSNGKPYKSNVNYTQKVSSNPDTASRYIMLNSNPSADGATSVIVEYQNAMPFTQKIKTLATKASYKQIANSLTYQVMGIAARANCYVYGLPYKVFNKNQDFFSTNSLVKVTDEDLGIDEPMNITGVSTTIDVNGLTNTVLNLVNQASFDTLDNIKIKKSLLKK